MKNKIISIVLAVALLLSMATVGLVTVSAADKNAAESSADTQLYFEMPSFWVDEYGTTPGASTTSVFFYIYALGGQDPDFVTPAWMAKATKATYNSATGLYYYNTSKLASPLKDDCDYAILIAAKSSVVGTTVQSYDLTMGAQCLGDTIYVTEQTYENPQDSKKICNAGYWRNAENAAIYGPHAGITSTGKIQGEVFGPHEDKELAIANFIKDFSANAEADTCPNLCTALEVEPYDVYVKYATTYAAEIEAGTCASLEVTAGLLGLSYPPEPPTTEPVTTEPVTTEPVTTEPVTTEPVTTEPVTTEPVTTEPVTTEPVTTEPVTTEPVTTEPVTTEPVTTEPVTTEPVTTEPVTTEPVTTEPVTTAPVADKYTVAGDFVVPTWTPAENEMTKGSYEFEGAAYDYSFTQAEVAAGSFAFKVTDGTWDNAWGNPDGSNISFTLSAPCDVTVYFNSDTKAIAVSADNLTTFTLESITVVGNGDGTWLNGAAWDLEDTSNDMTEVEPGIYSITYENVDAYDEYQFKYACNHSWQPYNWTSDGVFDGQVNPSNVVEQDGSTVIITLDVTGFDFSTGVGTVVPGFTVIPPTPEFKLGDVDHDGSVTIKDATAIQLYCAGLLEDGPSFDASLADYNDDGRISILDAAYIQLSLVNA